MSGRGEKSLLDGTPSTSDMRKREGRQRTGDARWRRRRTLALCGGFLGMGMAGSIMGPTLLDFACTLHVTLETMTWVFTSRSFGYLIGSLIAGNLLTRFNVSLLLGLSFLLVGIGYIALPWVANFVALLCLIIVLGLGMGAIDTGSNVLLLRLWKDGNGPYMQLVHFVFGFGAFVAPLLLTPFAAGTPSCVKSSVNTTTDSSYTIDDTTATLGSPTGNGTHAVTPISPVRFAFSAIGVLIVVLSTPFFIFTCFDRPRVVGLRKSKAIGEKKANSDFQTKERKYRLLLLALLFLFFMLYTGMEMAFGGLVASFSATSVSLKFDQPTAALLTSVYYGIFTLGRLLGIPTARYVKPAGIIGVSVGIGVVSSLILATLSESRVIVLWIFTGMLGLGMATVFPAGFSWANSKIRIEGRLASLPVVSASLGNMILPVVIGALMGRVGPHMLMWSALTATSLSFVVFASLLILASRHKFIPEPVPTDIQDNDDATDEPVSSVHLHPLTSSA